MKPIY